MLAAKTASRMCKSVPASARRKCARYGRGLGAAKLLRTAAHAQALATASTLAVDVAMAAYDSRFGLPRLSLPQALRRLRRTLVSGAAAYGGATLGMGVGTLLWPGYGTEYLGLLGSAAGQFALDSAFPRAVRR